MWLVMLVGAVLLLVGLAMWLCGADSIVILITLAVVALGCFYAFLAACIYLVTLLFAAGSVWPYLIPTVFIAFVAFTHWRAFNT